MEIKKNTYKEQKEKFLKEVWCHYTCRTRGKKTEEMRQQVIQCLEIQDSHLNYSYPLQCSKLTVPACKKIWPSVRNSKPQPEPGKISGYMRWSTTQKKLQIM